MRETITSLMDDALRRGDETAIVARHGLRTVRWSYEKLAVTAFQFARELEARGIGQNDRILIQAENSAEWVAAFFGCLLRGAVVVPLDVQTAPDFAARVQQQVTARLLLTDREHHHFENAPPSIPLTQLPQLCAPHCPARYQPDISSPDHLAQIIFTSGTTADPKGVCLSHRNLLASLLPLEREINKYLKWERFVHPIRFLNLVPLSHVFGQFMGLFVPPLLGGEVYFQSSLNPAEIIGTIRRNRISVMVAVPRQLDSLREKIEREAVAQMGAAQFTRSLERAATGHWLKRWWLFRRIHRRFGWKFWAFVAGGATLNAETESFWQRLGFAVVQGYGMTETAALISVNHPFKSSHGSIGKTLPGQEVRLSAQGEIMVRGGNVAAGYWHAGVQPLTDAAGWLHTGDVGEMDATGNLFFKGRSRDVIVTAAGLNIYPEDLEAALNAQPEIRACAVIGIETAQGPEPLAVLILREAPANADKVAARAIAHANATLARPQQMRHWVIWPDSDFPRTPTQKVRKGEVKARLAQLRPSPAASGAAPPTQASVTGSLLASVSGIAPDQLTDTASLSTDLKLDSLGRVELLSALEDRYQVQLDEAAITAATTVGDLKKMLAEGTAASSAVQYPYPRWAQRFPVTWLRTISFYLLLLPLTRLMSWPRVRGAEHLKGLHGPALFISNHIAMTDQSLIQAALPGRYRRHLAIAMEGERLRAFRHPTGAKLFTRWRLKIQYALLVALFNVFPLPQHSGFRRSFAYLGETMDRGFSVLVFPEGRRTEDGRMAHFKSGIGLLATSIDAPIVPVRIDGLFELKQRRQYFTRPGRITVTFGEPVRFAADDDPARIALELETRVSQL